MIFRNHQLHSFHSKKKKKNNQKKKEKMMGSCCSKRRIWVWSLCLIFFSLSYTIASSSPVKHLCLPDQKDALWEFKNEFYVQGVADDYEKTEEWKNDTDCCSWDGVSCDPTTGKVVELNLHSCSLNGSLRSNSSLFRLQHLQILDLSSNNISGILPDSIGNFKYLKVLDLMFCKFFGKIPSSLGNLSHLTHLYFYVNDFSGELPDSMGNLNRLTVLFIGSNKLSGKFPPSLLNLSELSIIYLGNNQFEGKLPSNMSSLSKLEYFSITGNSFSESIPSSLFTIPSLTWLFLDGNDFTGPLEIWNISSSSKLERLRLGENKFKGPIPGFISKLVRLRRLDLSLWNTETRMIDFSIFLHLKSLVILDLSYLNTTVDLSLFPHLLSLCELDLSGNNLKNSSTLHLPSSIGSLTFSSCNIVEFPKFLQTKTSLSYLDISANHIEGQVPEWLWNLPELQFVNISQNFFTGFEGSEDVIQRSSTFMLDISSNAFKDPFPLLPNSMEYFLGSDNQFSGEIPRTICELKQLHTLVLSNNNFSGPIPRCFQRLNNTLAVLHLRNNSISGVFPEESISDRLRSFDVGFNRLSGKLPKSLISCTALEFLNVEDNKINDEFPLWLSSLPNLQILVLRSNEFHGKISSPEDSLSFSELRIFDISRNCFTGVLPSNYFLGWNAMSSSVIIDRTLIPLVSNSSRYFPRYYHQSVSLVNKGLNMELVGSSFTIYKTIDISGNRFEGNIPESIGLLKGLIVLNMSNNAFTGHIPPSLENLTNLESLDLSQNALSGKIPPELGKLTFLEWMNFSYNMLDGPIPQSTQFQIQNSSSFAGNLGLCGVPLEETCGGGDATTKHQDAEEEESDQVISWTAAAIGCVPGIVWGLTLGHILNSYKPDWFMKIFHFCA